MDRVRRISTELLSRYPDRFATEFEENKKIVNELARIRSKILRNMVAGHITSYIRKRSAQNESSLSSGITAEELTEQTDVKIETQEQPSN